MSRTTFQAYLSIQVPCIIKTPDKDMELFVNLLIFFAFHIEKIILKDCITEKIGYAFSSVVRKYLNLVGISKLEGDIYVIKKT